MKKHDVKNIMMLQENITSLRVLLKDPAFLKGLQNVTKYKEGPNAKEKTVGDLEGKDKEIGNAETKNKEGSETKEKNDGDPQVKVKKSDAPEVKNEKYGDLKDNIEVDGDPDDDSDQKDEREDNSDQEDEWEDYSDLEYEFAYSQNEDYAKLRGDVRKSMRSFSSELRRTLSNALCEYRKKKFAEGKQGRGHEHGAAEGHEDLEEIVGHEDLKEGTSPKEEGAVDMEVEDGDPIGNLKGIYKIFSLINGVIRLTDQLGTFFASELKEHDEPEPIAVEPELEHELELPLIYVTNEMLEYLGCLCVAKRKEYLRAYNVELVPAGFMNRGKHVYTVPIPMIAPRRCRTP